MKFIYLFISKFTNNVIVFSRGNKTHIIKKQKHANILNQYGYDGVNNHVDVYISNLDRWSNECIITNNDKIEIKTAIISYFKKYKVQFL